MKPYQVVFETKDWIVVDKAAGVLTVPPRFPDSRLVLGRVLESDLSSSIYPVHRLDFEVSGIVVFAKNADFHRSLSAEFEQRRATKSYEALIQSTTQLDPQNWESKIVRGKKRSFVADHGQHASTHLVAAKVLPGTPFQLLRLKPLTGRPHQLRMECANRVGPIVGDSLYGSKLELKLNEIALRAVELEVLGQRFQVPSQLSDWLRTL
jgi:tRNA pseudouridine32 synthase/23S rRNA pseudouridine746 synthase